ncbi:CoxG family protein [Metallosphaera hakonensis]|uniref:Carbon monoxide dehydrogenase n=1 Tax=Metallosphaera hakonensis JCM 8857 = DSM 7519 TaxID=1293036 RepID=A0A2U9IS02_9CREN|nr:SRPBCC domain-containing protein [Metallosphaera hakonensis]AWR98821.1 carbon monoxide dehydrogenase [Metallosphaera hakonensis JCM 8857 = DSM 7519]
MKYQGDVRLNVDKGTIWNILSNPEQVSSCFPGIKSITKDGDSYKVVGSAGIGFIKGEYKATVTFSNVKPMEGMTITAKGTGLNSNVDIVAQVKVEDGKLTYDAEVKVAGVLASVGARLMDPAVNKLIQDLFECIRNKVEKR